MRLNPWVQCTTTQRRRACCASVAKAKRPRLFCVRLVSSDPARQFVFDTGSAEEQQRWVAAMQRFAPVAAQDEGAFRQYAFALSLCGVEALQFAVRHR